MHIALDYVVSLEKMVFNKTKVPSFYRLSLSLLTESVCGPISNLWKGGIIWILGASDWNRWHKIY